MSKMWEVDPETRSKLLLIQKTNGNDRCCDCGAPSPQWASPKFGTFICLNCAGTHRGLGVHISFIRSITMDAFKGAEIQRMEKGGNDPWKNFYDEHAITVSEGRTFEDSTIKERYDGEVGEEWKERLTAKIEGREYVPGQRKKQEAPSRSSTPRTQSRSMTPDQLNLSGGSGSGPTSRKEQNETYFARLGNENSARPDGLAPSQGGKYSGFGGGMPTAAPSNRGASGPAMDDFQKDPMAAITKGFGWFASTVGKSAKTVNDSYLQPAAKQIAASDFAAQARTTAGFVGQNIQTGARGAAEQLNRFVEGPDDRGVARSRSTRSRVEPERKDFWDDFAAVGEERERKKPSAVGTAAMRNSTIGASAGAGAGAGTGFGASGSSTAVAASKKDKEKDDWDESW